MSVYVCARTRVGVCVCVYVRFVHRSVSLLQLQTRVCVWCAPANTVLKSRRRGAPAVARTDRVQAVRSHLLTASIT